MQRLKVGLIAPPWFAVPPLAYGGIEWIVSLLADGLVARGHDVTLFASGGSQTPARLVSAFPSPPSASLGAVDEWMVAGVAAAAAYAHHDEFDIIHDHSSLGPICAAAIETPVVHTVHNGLNPRLEALYRQLASKVHYVCVSCDQRSIMPAGTSATTIHNAIDVSRYPFAPVGGDHLLFVGRMSADKGIIDAIEIARRSGRKLVILAKINEAAERDYFESSVEPALAGIDAEFVQNATLPQKVDAYQRAYATLFPISWREPFGLVMAESMSCGTPVIAYRCGSVPEVIVDGKTGFVCDGLDDAVAAVDRIDLLKREDCRARVETHFSAERLVARHEELYLRLLGRSAEESPRFEPAAAAR